MMVPPTGPLNLNVEAISGICGSISIACWVVVFSPQIIENFRRGSADGLSLQFIIVWLAGDVFNILGAVLQKVLPTMIILAVYYTIADIVLLGQCFYYRGFTWKDEVVSPKPRARKNKTKRSAAREASAEATETSALLSHDSNSNSSSRQHVHHPQTYDHRERRPSWSALSPAIPFVPELGSSDFPTSVSLPSASATSPVQLRPAVSRLQAAAFNILAILMVCAAGVAGWYLSGGVQGNKNQLPPAPPPTGEDGSSGDEPIVFSVWGQVFGYFCAVLYLGSRLPQLLLNWRRQSTEGVSMLFFLFACLGNLTYVLSIFAHEEHGDYSPREAWQRYGRYLLVNLSWLAGSLGTLLLDMGIFIQFFMYQRIQDDESEDDKDDDTEVATSYSDDEDYEDDGDDEDGAQRRLQRQDGPILQRNISYHG